ncbi:MAG: hypothetical protein ABIW32_07225 [Terrimesophilobacter sp.]
MSRARKVLVIVVSLIAIALIVVVVVFGVTGINQTVSSGGQAEICGAQVDVTISDQIVELNGISNERLAPGDRVQVNALCVVEIISIDAEGGGAAQVNLRWRLW